MAAPMKTPGVYIVEKVLFQILSLKLQRRFPRLLATLRKLTIKARHY